MLQLQPSRQGSLGAPRGRHDRIGLSYGDYSAMGLRSFEPAQGMLAQHRAAALRLNDQRIVGAPKGEGFWMIPTSLPRKDARRTMAALFAVDVALISFDLALLAGVR
jgi:hypothetical protein